MHVDLKFFPALREVIHAPAMDALQRRNARRLNLAKASVPHIYRAPIVQTEPPMCRTSRQVTAYVDFLNSLDLPCWLTNRELGRELSKGGTIPPYDLYPRDEA
jgi:hypothetical protein